MKKIFAILLVLGLLGGLSVSAQAQQDQPYTKIGDNLYAVDRSIFSADKFPDNAFDGMYIPPGSGPLCSTLHPEWFDQEKQMLNIDPNAKLPDDGAAIQAECRMITLRSKTPDKIPNEDRGGVYTTRCALV